MPESRIANRSRATVYGLAMYLRYRRSCLLSRPTSLPLMNTFVTAVLTSSGSPFAMKRFASLPASRLPTRSATPRISAALIVSALRASSRFHSPGDGHRRVVGHDADVGAVSGRERHLHPSLRQLAGELIVGGVKGILAGRQRQNVAENHRDVLLLEQRRDDVGFGAAADDDVDLHAIGESHGVPDVLGAIYGGDERQPALDDRDERLERPVDRLLRAGLRVGAHLIEEAREIVEASIACRA